MSDPVNQYMALYTITHRNAVEYSALSPLDTYAIKIKAESSVKCDYLQGASTVSGSFRAAIVYIGGSLTVAPTSPWGVEQVGLLKKLFVTFGLTYTGLGSSLNPGVSNGNPDRVRQYLTLYRITYRQANEYLNQSVQDSGYGLSLKEQCSDGTIVVAGSRSYGKCFTLIDQTGLIGSLKAAVAYINDTSYISAWSQSQVTALQNLLNIFEFTYNGSEINYVFNSANGTDFSQGANLTETTISCNTLLFNMTIPDATNYNYLQTITFAAGNYDFASTSVTITNDPVILTADTDYSLSYVGFDAEAPILAQLIITVIDITKFNSTTIYSLLFSDVIGTIDTINVSAQGIYAFSFESGSDFSAGGDFTNTSILCNTVNFSMTIPNASNYNYIQTITFANADYDFSGTTVTITTNSSTLVLNTDYSLSYDTTTLTINVIIGASFDSTTIYSLLLPYAIVTFDTITIHST